MASLTTLKLSFAALLGVGFADLAWIGLSLGPRALAERATTSAPTQLAMGTPATGAADQPSTGAPDKPSTGAAEPAAIATEAAADKAAADKAAADKAAMVDKAAADKVAADKVAADKVAADKIAADKIAADKIAADKVAADKVAADKAAGLSNPPPELPSSQVYFDSMSKRLGIRARAALSRLVQRAHARSIFQLEGHADYRGDERFNEELSKERADAAAAFLIKQGISPAQIKREHFGEQGAAEAPADELWRDRRVDIRIIEGGT